MTGIAEDRWMAEQEGKQRAGLGKGQNRVEGGHSEDLAEGWGRMYWAEDRAEWMTA